MTRREYLTIKMLGECADLVPDIGGYPLFVITEAVASTALAHPEWDMAEERSWDEWEAET